MKDRINRPLEFLMTPVKIQNSFKDCSQDEQKNK